MRGIFHLTIARSVFLQCFWDSPVIQKKPKPKQPTNQKPKKPKQKKPENILLSLISWGSIECSLR